MSRRSIRLAAATPSVAVVGIFVATMALHAGAAVAHPGPSDSAFMSATADRAIGQVRSGDDDPFDDPDMRHYPLSLR